MRNLISIQPVQAHECLSACTGNIIAIKYPSVSGNELVIAGEGFRVTYNSDTKILGSSMYHSNFQFLGKYNVAHQHKKLDLSDDPIAFVKKVLGARKYLLVRLDAKLLTYDRVFKQANHSSHFVNIMGVFQNCFCICDGYVPTKTASTFIGEVSVSELLTAWKGMDFEFFLFDSIPDLDVTGFLQDVRNELVNSIRIYRQGGKEGNLFKGKDAVIELFRELDYLSSDRVFEVNFQMKIYGFLSLKQIVCEVLKKMPGANEILDDYYQVLAEWNKICMLMVKIGLSSRKEQYADLLERVYKCVEAEDKVLERILSL